MGNGGNGGTRVWVMAEHGCGDDRVSSCQRCRPSDGVGCTWPSVSESARSVSRLLV